MLTIFIITLIVFGIAMLIMAIGVMFSRRCLHGSCGGEGVIGPDGELVTCPDCPRRKEKAAQAEKARGM
ncbi:MAG: (Na+)-NQR maturation NqrM [Candidatus Hydrogenedentes bacterium]|nr:(Na+)-NQR maturation NqrM [Candidatus Hydrogenedentota bacterium]